MVDQTPSDEFPPKMLEDSLENASVMSEENDSEIKPIIAETKVSDKALIIDATNGSDTAPIIDETNGSDTAPVIAETNGSDTAPEVGDEHKDIVETTGEIEPKVNDSGRPSAAKRGGKERREGVQPRYLGGSVGSCHDHCKYGIKHNIAPKPWKSLRRKPIKTENEAEDTEKIETPVTISKEKSNVVPASGSETEKPDELSKGKIGTSRSIKKGNSVKRDQKEAAVLVRGPNRPKVSGTNSNSSKNMNGVPSPNNQKSVRKAKPQDLKAEDVLEKTLYAIEPGVGNGELFLSPEKKTLKGAHMGTRNGSSLPPKEKKITRGGEKGVTGRKIIPPTTSLPAQAKALRPIRRETRPAWSASSSSSRRLSSKSNSSASSYEHNENKSENRMSNSQTESKVRPKRIGIKVAPTQKTNFRRGKVIELQQENSTPRRLKFKTRILQEKQTGKGDAQRRKFKESVARGSGPGQAKPERVVLKHRKTEGKKKVQILFNNVIEETATKLVETRKSKVKALVGAFETVISLQDDKTYLAKAP